MTALVIFVATLTLVVWQPRGLGVGWSALLGAAVALAAGVVSPADIPAVWTLVWDATFTLVALILISLILDAAGFFEWAALHVARWGGKRGRVLFVLSVLLGAVTAAFFANDGAVLILTPLVFELLHALKLPPRDLFAFVIATGFVADAASLPLKISNLTNIIVANYFHLSFAEYAAVMVPVNAVAVAASLVVLFWLFCRDLPREVDPASLADPRSAIRDPFVFRAGWGGLALLLLGYFFAHSLGLPVSAVAGGGALLLVLAAGREHFLRRQPRAVIPLFTLLREAPWQVVVFSLGMYLVVFGLRDAGLTAWLSRLLEWLDGQGVTVATVGSGFLFAALSAVMNNLPSVLVGSLAIADAHLSPAAKEAMIYANVVGCNLGPKITPIGSLATLLWLHVLAQRGMKVGWGEYCRLGLLLTVPVLLATLLALVGWLTLSRWS